MKATARTKNGLWMILFLLLAGCAVPALDGSARSTASGGPSSTAAASCTPTEKKASSATGSFSFRTPMEKTPSMPQGGMTLVPSVRGCAQTDQGSTTKGGAAGEEKEPSIEVIGHTIRYSRSIPHQCCRAVKFKFTVKDSDIAIYEVWSGGGCKCMCFSDIAASLESVPAGNYLVRVYESGTLPGGEPMEEKLLISKGVSVI
jgi:hypothetical protein